MQVLLVEKENRFSSSYVERFIAFDPTTREVYLSDAGARQLQWKKSMRLYAVRLNYVYTDLDMRHKDCDVRDLLAFTVYGVNERHLGRAENLTGLPDLRHVHMESAPTWGSYVEGDAMQRSTHGAESGKDDDTFLSTGGCTWHLRCRFYGSCHDTLMCMRDVLIADGLRAPVYGGLPGGIDPRHGLHFAAVPLYLQRDFHALLNAIVYSCTHGELVGCSQTGQLGIALKHAYLCVTEEQILFLSEEGKAVRWLPLRELDAVEYSVHDGDAAASSFVVFVMRGDAPDVVFRFTDTFTPSTASASLVAAMPRCAPAQELASILSILQQLLKSGLCAVALPAEVAPETGTAHAMTLHRYVEEFAARHGGRGIRWQPLLSYSSTHATVPSATALAERLSVSQPVRQTITYNPNFNLFYCAIPRVTQLGRGHSDTYGANESRAGSHGYDREDASTSHASRSRLVRMVQSLTPDPNMY